MALSILRTTLSRFLATTLNLMSAHCADTHFDCSLSSAETPELYLRLTTKCMEQVDRMTTISTAPRFNQGQCKYLVDKLKLAVRSAHSYLELINTWHSPFASDDEMAQLLEIFKLLFALGKDVESFIGSCCKDAWIQSAILLTNVSEHISSMGFNLQIFTIVFANRKIFGAIPGLTITEVASVRKVETEIAKQKAEIDKLRLNEDLNALTQMSQPSSVEWQLATFLLERLKSQRQHPGPDLPGFNHSSYTEILSSGLKQLGKLGTGSFGTVHKATWMGTEVAKKTVHGPRVEDFLQEVSTLEGLCHPNIVSLLWYMADLRKCYMIMELMDGDLYSLIQERLEECGIDDPPFTISEAVHIMLQVAEGMLYLHGKRIVHRDLKSSNILVRRVKPTEVGVKYVHAKVADFGLSKTKNNSMTVSIQTQNMGSTRWMAPEMIKIANEHGQAELLEGEVQLKYPFRIDVYSFAMLCYEILTGDLPFSTLGPNEVKKKVLGGDRPQLPDECPDRLRNLIEACWSSEASRRPRFGDICAELRHLKYLHFMTSTWVKAPRCFSSDEISRMTNNFSKDNMLSWGALSMVYKGVMGDTGVVVAVKRIFKKYFRCLDKFSTQMELLSGLHHKNLVGSVGFCYAEDETILVFEYISNDTLNKWLSEAPRKVNMTWPVRRNICLGVAHGIHYLHFLAQLRIIHHHIKASNIFLDQTYEPKIGGFQLALLVPDDESEIRSLQRCAGSLGYLAPEYATEEQLSEKVDVYSFGVVLLEIVSGRRSIDPKLPEDQINLGEWAEKLRSEGRIKELIDPTLNLQRNEEIQAVRIVKLALLCMHTAVETRPDMSLVVELLQENLDVEISRLGLECDKERFGMSMDQRGVSFGSSSGDFEVDCPSSSWKLDHFAEAEEQSVAVLSTEEGESNDANFDGHIFDEPLERKVQTGLEYLSSTSYPKVLAGFAQLIECASLSGGPLAVFNAKYVLAPPSSPALPAPPIVIQAIPTVIKLAKTQDPQYSKLAVKLMEALTSDKGGRPESEIILEVSDALDVLISLMKEESLTITRLLAAETVANILVNRQVRKTVLRGYDGIVAVLIAFLNVDATSLSIKHLNRASNVCLKALQRLAKCSKRGDKTQMIVAALIKLLRRGLSYQPELKCLVKDSLVALENQVLELDHATSTNEVCMVVWKDMLELMLTGGFVSHTTVPGRMAIISIMTKLCALYKEDINKHLFLYLFKVIKGIGSEIANLLEASQPLPQEENVAEQLRSLTKLLATFVRLLCFCATHGKDTAQSVLSENVEERRTLEELLVRGGTSGISDESRLQILFILNQIAPQATVVGGMEVLVNMSKSNDQTCRQQVASTLRMLVAGKQNLTELEEAGGIAALMALLEDPNPNCQGDALVALQALPPSIALPVGRLPLQTVVDFLSEMWPIDVRNAAVGLLDLLLNDEAVYVDIYSNTKGALEATLKLLVFSPDSLASQKVASALLEMAKEGLLFRQRIAEPGLRGLDILLNYVRGRSTNELKELLTATLVLFCYSGETCQEAVINADGHSFLLTSLQEYHSKEKAAQGLLELVRNTRTSERVLEAGFVTTAMRSIDGSFACTDIALCLACISSTEEGLNQIYSDSHSVSALLILLEYCPNPTGKDAAALVIARLYPRLNRQEDVARQRKITEACYLFIRCLDPLDISHSKEFLEALAAIAAEELGRIIIYEYRGHQLLINYLSVTQTDIQSLVLKILAEMSSDLSENGVGTIHAMRTRNSFMEHRIAEKLFGLFNSEEFNWRMDSMKDALILIRNLSLSGSYVCEELAEQGAVTLLLNVLKRHENSLSVVTELAVKALEKFMNDPKGRQVFIKGGGINSLVAVLKLDGSGRTDGAKSFSTIILTTVAKDPQTRKTACETIFDCNILSALSHSIFSGETSTIRWQAAVLMKLLAMYGPTKKVCSAMRLEGCLDALIALRHVVHCNEHANDVLKFVGEKSKSCKAYIDVRLSQLDG